MHVTSACGDSGGAESCRHDPSVFARHHVSDAPVTVPLGHPVSATRYSCQLADDYPHHHITRQSTSAFHSATSFGPALAGAAGPTTLRLPLRRLWPATRWLLPSLLPLPPRRDLLADPLDSLSLLPAARLSRRFFVFSSLGPPHPPHIMLYSVLGGFQLCRVGRGPF